MSGTAAGNLALGLIGTGRMGEMVERVAGERGHRIVLRLDAGNNRNGEGITADSVAGVDCLIDFSIPDAVLPTVRSAGRCGCSVVLGTTGWDRQEGALEEVRSIAQESGIGILFSPNFSLGMRRFLRIVEDAARAAGADPELDVWVEETHHRGKADHPSGTAWAIAERLLPLLPSKRKIRTELPDGMVDPSDLHVTVTRGGWVPGTHRVVIDGSRETIELVHTARSREVFALGAVRAAEWLRGRTGFFTLDDLMNEETR